MSDEPRQTRGCAICGGEATRVFSGCLYCVACLPSGLGTPLTAGGVKEE